LSLILAAGAKQKVLVLGSGGLVGRSAVRWLRAHDYQVVEVRDRQHVDLRVAGALDRFNASNIAYCFFLACEVGGSKFIDDTSEDVQTSILTSNLRIYQNVLPWLLVKLEQWRKVLVPWLDMWCLGLGKENTVPLHVLVPAGDAQCVWRHQAAGGAVGAADGRPGQDPPAVERLR